MDNANNHYTLLSVPPVGESTDNLEIFSLCEWCGQALRAVRATYYASVDQPNDWTGTPVGWNDEHRGCYERTARNDARCAYHHECYQELRKTT